MLQRTALCTGKNSQVNELAHHLYIAFVVFHAKGIFKILFYHNDTAAWPAQGFVRGGSNNMAMVKRRTEQTFGNQARQDVQYLP